MQLLENMYLNVILNEKLKVVNLDADKIKAVVEDEYAKWRERYGIIPVEKRRQFEMHPDDVTTIATIIPSLYAYDKRYTDVFRTGDINAIKKQLATLDKSWRNFIETRIPRQFVNKQPVYLALIRLVHEAGLRLPISNTTNPVTGLLTQYPVYPLHLLHKYVQMNILENEFNMPPELRQKIEEIIFDNATRSQIQLDIDAYNTRTGRI